MVCLINFNDFTRKAESYIDRTHVIKFDVDYFADTGTELWDSVYGLSAVGKKRGRGRVMGKIRKIDLNIGRKLGDGNAIPDF